MVWYVVLQAGSVRCGPCRLPIEPVLNTYLTSAMGHQRPRLKKSISVNNKSRGRPATGHDPVSAVRLSEELAAKIDAWSAKNDAPNRSEAIRRLVELASKAK
ncbi:ribbon-helix-helix domain-containing protein [Bradyrhizobium sp. AZCC 1610]|uniref:ribbon-helix-helix domain-containing protein n=1 Tax=Bradyrhizobium sp. AZCC 1610 TaxID=3117020 RepID=UPI002FF313BB